MNKRTRDLFTDQDLLNGLKNRDADVITAIYHQNIDLIISFVTRNSGSQEDAEDLFQDAIMILYEKIGNERIELTCSLYALSSLHLHAASSSQTSSSPSPLLLIYYSPYNLCTKKLEMSELS